MKRRGFILLFSWLSLFIFPVLSGAETSVSADLTAAEWTWNEKSIASFEGFVSFGSNSPDSVLLKLSVQATPEASDSGEAVFQAINGKKLTLRKQSSEYLLSPVDASVCFTGNWRTPESVYFTRVQIRLEIFDGSSLQKLSEHQLIVTRDASELSQVQDGKIRIKSDFSLWTVRIAAAAGVVWLAAVVRFFMKRKKK